MRHLPLISYGCRRAPLPCCSPYLSDAVSGVFFSVSARCPGRGRSPSVRSASTAVTAAALLGMS